MREHRRMRSVIAAGALLVACGGDDGAAPVDAPQVDSLVDAAGACGPTGSGTFEGTISGTAVAPVLSASIIDGTLWEIGIFENATCAPNGTGQFLDIQFCAQPEVGVHPVVLSRDQACPTAEVAVLYIDEPTGLADATAGTVTIDAVGACTTGSYDLTFPGGHVTGTFSAVSALACP
jgi:hypothetical protein